MLYYGYRRNGGLVPTFSCFFSARYLQRVAMKSAYRRTHPLHGLRYIEAKGMSVIRPSLFLLFLLSLFLFPMPSHAAESYTPVSQTNQPVRIEITGLTFDQATGTYRVGLAIDRPDRIQRVILNVESESGTLVIDELVNPGGRPNLTLEFAANRLGPAGKYLIKIRALDLVGNLVEKVEEFGGSGEEPSVLASREFTYSPDGNTVNFTIESVNADYINDRLIVILNVEQPQRVISYSGFIVNNGGQRVLDIPRTIFPNPPRLEVPLPPAMRTGGSADSGEAPEYKVTINLTTQDNQSFQQVFEGFKPVPPPPPGMMTQITQALSDNPILPVIIIAIISSAVVFIILRNRKPAPDLPSYRPPVDHTVEIHAPNVAPARQAYAGPAAAPARRMRLRIRVIESPGMQPNTEQIIDTFPYVFGRGLWLNDPQMSREHATVTMKSGQFFITDNKSRNGTTVRDLTLTADQTVPLEGSTIVRLGLNTMLEIEPYG